MAEARVENPWDAARRRLLSRTSGAGVHEPLDRGVNYFVLALEKLGAKPRFSCEGHPTGFYVMFEAPYALAQRIRNAGFFNVELEGRNRWSIRLMGNEYSGGRPWRERERRRCLRWAAAAWERVLFGRDETDSG